MTLDRALELAEAVLHDQRHHHTAVSRQEVDEVLQIISSLRRLFRIVA